MKIKSLAVLGNLFVLTFVLCSLLGCAPKASTLPEDMPLSEFMIGEWQVVSRVNTDTGEALAIAFPKVSISRDAISYGDTYRAEYEFTGKDSIFVDNKRLTGGKPGSWNETKSI